MTKHSWFVVRKTRAFKGQVQDLMKARGFVTYSELFRAVVRDAWERLLPEERS